MIVTPQHSVYQEKDRTLPVCVLLDTQETDTTAMVREDSNVLQINTVPFRENKALLIDQLISIYLSVCLIIPQPVYTRASVWDKIHAALKARLFFEQQKLMI